METPLRRYTIPTGGYSYTLDATDTVQRYVFDGSGDLVGNVSIDFDAIANTDLTYCVIIEYRGQFTLGTSTITINGYDVSEAQAITGNTTFVCTYIGAAWQDPFVTNSFPSVGNDLGKTIVVDSVLGNDTTGQRESLLYRFKTLDAALAASQTNDMIWLINGSYTQTVPMPHSLSFRCEPLAVVNFGDAFDSPPSACGIHIEGFGQISCNNIGTTTANGLFLWVECFTFSFKTVSIPSNAFGAQHEVRIKAFEYAICQTNISIKDDIYIRFVIDTPQLYLYNLYEGVALKAIDIENLSTNSTVEFNCEVVEDVQNVGYKFTNIAYCKKDVNGDFTFTIDKVTLKNGITDEAILAEGNVSTYPQTNRFLVKDLINHLGTTGSVLRSFNNGIIQKKGDIFVKQSSAGVGKADTDANIESYIYLEDCNVYYEGTAQDVFTLTNTNSRISFNNVKIVSSTATNDVYGLIAACKYQGLFLASNLAEGAQCSNEIASGFVVRDVLIK